MSELKTLEDFNHGEYCPQCKLSISIFDIEGFRKEAINWVKSEMPKKKKDIRDREIVNWFIRHFFNITEEDLI